MNGVISGRDVVNVVAIHSVLIGGGVTSEEGLGYENSVKGAITGGVDVTVLMILWTRKEIDPQSISESSDFSWRDIEPEMTSWIVFDDNFVLLLASGLLAYASGSGPIQSLSCFFQGLIQDMLTLYVTRRRVNFTLNLSP
ncbi:hypothetical protein Tco_0656606 [Tanacetum coccineum]|uniref:Uncharacterized protein n=1 Tax=Tanacetum coccineum TaxID=301880 RepID=A0ABQ4X9N8_9ASTR